MNGMMILLEKLQTIYGKLNEGRIIVTEMLGQLGIPFLTRFHIGEREYQEAFKHTLNFQRI